MLHIYYSDVDCNIDDSLKKFENLEINKIVNMDWIGIISTIKGREVRIKGCIKYCDIDSQKMINILQENIQEIDNIKEGIIFNQNKKEDWINLLVVPVRARVKFKVFLVCGCLRQAYNQKDLQIVKSYTKIIYENILLNNVVVQEKNYLQNIFNSTESAIICTDLEGKITTANKATSDVFGLKTEKILGKKYYELLPYEEKNKIQEAISYVINSNKSYIFKEEIFSTKKRGKIVINLTVSPLNDSQNQAVGLVIIGTDVTKLKVFERELEQIKQLALLGELAAGVAHDIKNPLMSIRGCARILEKNLYEYSKHREFIEPIIYEVDRINIIVEQMLSYAFMTKENNYALININEVLDKCYNVICFHKESKYITIEKYLAKDLPLISGNNVQLQQAFINILINAVQAIENEGIIRIKSYNLKQKKKILVIISDNGRGISSEEMEAIFTPFYSTKKNGTGLGLSIVKNVVDKHGGEILFSSKINEGTKCQVYLPY